MSDPLKGDDLHPENLRVYGYAVAYRHPETGRWFIDEDDSYRNLPGHDPYLPTALDAVANLKSKGIECRVVAVLVQSTDTGEEFERNKIEDETENTFDPFEDG